MKVHLQADAMGGRTVFPPPNPLALAFLTLLPHLGTFFEVGAELHRRPQTRCARRCDPDAGSASAQIVTGIDPPGKLEMDACAIGALDYP